MTDTPDSPLDEQPAPAGAEGVQPVAEHREAQQLGRERWYRSYRIRVCRVESGYGFER
jgi:hypothetical protein